ncbi:MAG TPA: SCO family protein [Pyrinomonadaceae bacterium]|nr:SCO family protein [Pyrinomonadaceae bacterium]
MRKHVRLAPLPALVLLLSTLFGCARPEETAEAKRYELKGTVVSFDKNQRQVIVAHEEVPGLMEAMTMPFTLKDGSAYEVMQPGAKIQATLAVSGERSWLENPIITVFAPDQAANATTSSLREPAVGEEVPDFTLVNQDGRRVGLRDYRGRALALTFIYTRCPLPDYCPLMSENFAAVNSEMAKDPALASRARLLSVTVDPEYDTPKVLRSYGAAHTGEFSGERFGRWQFATGAPEEVRRLAEHFGLSYAKDGDQIIHSLRTAVITADGRLFKLYRGNEWKPADLLADLRTLAAGADKATDADKANKTAGADKKAGP